MKKLMGVFLTATLIVGGLVTISPKPTFATLCNPNGKTDCPVGPHPKCPPAPRGNMQEMCSW
ncbi:hypothetical protein EGH10_16015 [Brevibacillus laterosporus]|uniref:Uncharacterized protein n=1 Tax=Brevibacillus laterosporus LMG 15441 TaxID=1042163 RepID=A0A075R2D3_BRELA|nr:hypothetical protein [Brevibacillus laterosporus]AIG26019.1 hypothetical protein BRLA_c016950 [Brevibacillus laterosporus LMG 15441]ERM17734.1 hypothetical protein P615_19185 [Brevibacillus laterosporus PE36]RJL13033.1 hypothetical protein DM460_07905 [Brevibacillus laterosporus]TPH08054.1 hypothetical protein EGH10_16015 [Brevibacillus laterosporus]